MSAFVPSATSSSSSLTFRSSPASLRPAGGGSSRLARVLRRAPRATLAVADGTQEAATLQRAGEELVMEPPTRENPVGTLRGLSNYLRMLREASEREELVVIRFKARWCRSCRAVEPKVKRLAHEFADKKVSFWEVDFEDDKDMCRNLAVTSLPTFHFYYGAAGRIEDFTCGPLRTAQLREKLEMYLNDPQPHCDLADHDAADV